MARPISLVLLHCRPVANGRAVVTTSRAEGNAMEPELACIFGDWVGFQYGDGWLKMMTRLTILSPRTLK
jgi:hypothetical protein